MSYIHTRVCIFGRLFLLFVWRGGIVSAFSAPKVRSARNAETSRVEGQEKRTFDGHKRCPSIFMVVAPSYLVHGGASRFAYQVISGTNLVLQYHLYLAYVPVAWWYIGSFLSESVFSIVFKVWKYLEICINMRRRSVTIREILQNQKYRVR